MALKLMYITNRPDVAKIAEAAGVDRIFVDMEYIGKKERQNGLDTVQSNHTLEDVSRVRQAITKSQLLVRCNPIHKKAAGYIGSEEEINAIIERGADIVMLPYFKTTGEVEDFIRFVGGRARTCLLLETPEAAENVDAILSVPGIDEVMIGLNDLSLGYHKKFMFELLADGTVDYLCGKCAERNIPYGFGGVASLGKGLLLSEYVIKEHYRLNSSIVILSRSFCNLDVMKDIKEISIIFQQGVHNMREYEKYSQEHPETYEKNHRDVIRLVNEIVACD